MHLTALSSNEMCEFSGEVDGRWGRGVHEGQAVHQISEPLTLLFPCHVQPPEGVVERFAAQCNLRSQRLLAEMQERTTKLEVARKVVLPVQPHHGLALQTVVGVGLYGALDGCSSIEDALVEDAHDTSTVIHCVVTAFGEDLSASGHDHTSLRNAGSVEDNLVTLCGFVATFDDKLVVLCHLFGNGARGVVEFCVGKFACHISISNDICQETTEGLHLREENTPRSCVDGVAFHEVKVAIGHATSVVVQIVQAEER